MKQNLRIVDLFEFLKSFIKTLTLQFKEKKNRLQILKDKKQEGKLKKHAYDKSGNSITQSTYFNLSDGRIRILCTDWSEKLTNEKNWSDTLTVNIYSNEFRHWVDTKAYK